MKTILPTKHRHITQCQECNTTLLYEREDIQGIIFESGHPFKFVVCPICGAEIIVFDEASE